MNCTDKVIAREPQLAVDTAEKWEKEAPTFGRNQAFSDVASCSNWPATNPDVYRGPSSTKAKTPVLVVGNYFDPATQFEFSKRMVQELGNARLVSVNAFGHCILGESRCVNQIAAKYLTELKAPEPGVVCQPDKQPFD